VPVYVTPGGIITIYVAGLSPTAIPANAGQFPGQFPLPTVLGGINASIEQFSRTGPVVPLISVFGVPTCPTDPNDVSPSCGALTGIRLQIPFEVVPYFGILPLPKMGRTFSTEMSSKRNGGKRRSQIVTSNFPILRLSTNMKSAGKRSRLRRTAWLRAFVGTW